MLYAPPSPEALKALKAELGLSSAQMAQLFGVADGRQWRKYTGGDREISPQILFFAMARLELDEAVIERILDRMRRAGATIDLAHAGEPER
jgi:transcriptional regulator with XRE-family HTH domain